MPITERDLESPDPLRLSREIAEVAQRVRRFHRRLEGGEGQGDDPFFSGRIVAGKRAFDAVRTLPAEDPLRRSLERWIYRLADGRIHHASWVGIAHERRHALRVVSEPERVRLTLSAILDRALGDPARRRAWLSSYLAAAEPLGDAVATLWERRAEVAARMGVGRPDTIESAGANVAHAAESWLSRTEDAFAEIANGAETFFQTALGEGAVEGWPRQLTSRVMADLFRETDLLRGLDLDPGELPRPHAPASFLRALCRIGAAWVDATAPADQPFVVAHDPYGLRRFTVGALFGGFPLTRSFARRALGIDPSRLDAHRRALHGTVLVESRAAALRVLLYGAALDGRRAFRERFEALVSRAHHLALAPRAAGSLWMPRVDGHQRFAGLLLSASEARRLRDAHDEDWYRNPRASEELRDEARRSPDPNTTDTALERGAEALYQEITAGLG